MLRLTLALALMTTTSVNAAMKMENVPYALGETPLEGVLIYDDAWAKKPGLLLVPNWLGITEANLSQAREVAARGYVVFVADMFGVHARPRDPAEAGKLVGPLKADRPRIQRLMTAALDTFARTRSAPLDATKLAAIGFCFGGTAALELARAGAKLAAVVSFHGGLAPGAQVSDAPILAKVLALHGADDPAVPEAEVRAFEQEMRAKKADWQLVAFGNTVHSFTDVGAKTKGRAEYNPTVARRAYTMMEDWLAEAFGS